MDDDSFVNPRVLWDNLEHALLHTATTKSFMSYLEPSQQIQEEEEDEDATGLPPVQESESVDYLFMGHVQTAVPIRDPKSKW